MSRPDPITSATNPTVRRLVRMRDNRSRRRAQCVLVDGWRETQRAVDGGLALIGLFVVDGECPTDSRPLIAAAQEQGVLQFVTPAVMDKIGYGQSSRGVLAEFTAPDRNLDQLELGERPLVLVLDQIEKPGNIGAVFRCADAVGVDAVLSLIHI